MNQLMYMCEKLCWGDVQDGKVNQSDSVEYLENSSWKTSYIVLH